MTRKNWLSPVKKSIDVSHAFLLLFLPLPCLMILKPIENILSLNVTESSQSASYLLYLLSAGCSYSLHIQILKHIYLLFCWVPPRGRRSSTGITTITAVYNIIALHVLVKFPSWVFSLTGCLFL